MYSEEPGPVATHEEEPIAPVIDWNSELDTFRVFTWLCVRTPDEQNSIHDTQTIDLDYLSRKLEEVHTYLWSNKREHERSAYRKCKEITYNEFLAKFEKRVKEARQRKTPRKPSPSPSRGIGSFEEDTPSSEQCSRKFVLSAEALFQTFLPLGYESSVASKYWGGVSRIASVSSLL